MTSTLLAILSLGAAGLSVTPEVIVAVVVAFVVTNTLPSPVRMSRRSHLPVRDRPHHPPPRSSRQITGG